MALTSNTLGILFVRASSADDTESAIGTWLTDQRISQAISTVTETVHRRGGIVVKSLSDSVLATFPAASSALKAAVEIQAQSARDQQASTASAQGAGRAPVDLRVTLHYGQLVVAAGNISGEVMEQTALLANQTLPGQILAAEALTQALRGDSRRSAGGLGARAVDLRGTTINVVDIPWREGDVPVPEASGEATAMPPEPESSLDTPEPSPRPAAPAPPPEEVVPGASPAAPGAPTARPGPAAVPDPAARAQAAPPETVEPVAEAPQGGAAEVRLQVSFEGTQHTVDASNPTLTLGRSPDNMVVVTSPHVSRKHAVIVFADGAFHLINNSANGSCVRREGQKETRCDDRQRLEGSGVIGLGPDHARCDKLLIGYRID